jgi:hypothetical protein
VSQVERFACFLFSRNYGVLRTQPFYLTQPHVHVLEFDQGFPCRQLKKYLAGPFFTDVPVPARTGPDGMSECERPFNV